MTTITFTPIQANNNSTSSFLANDPYINTFWLPILGPTATLLLNHLMSSALCEYDEFVMDLAELSSTIGVGNREGNSSPIVKNLKRLCDFGLISKYQERYYIPTNIEPMCENHLRKLNTKLQCEHSAWLNNLNQNPLLTQRQKARFVYISLTLKSINQNKIQTALSRTGLHPSIIGEAIKQFAENSTAA